MTTVNLDDDKIFQTIRGLEGNSTELLWAQGDYILEERLSDATLATYSRALGLSRNTLRKRANVCLEFPHRGGLRDNSRPFGVFEKLLPIKDDDVRSRLLREMEVCTVDQMAKRVQRFFHENADAQGIRRRGPVDKKRQGMRIGVDGDAVYIHAERRGDNLDIYIEHPNVHFVDKLESDGKVAIVAKLS